MSNYEYDFSDGVKQITAIMKGEGAEWETVTTQMADSNCFSASTFRRAIVDLGEPGVG